MENRKIIDVISIFPRIKNLSAHSSLFLSEVNQTLTYINNIQYHKLSQIIDACDQLKGQTLKNFAVLETARKRNSFTNSLTDPKQQSILTSAISSLVDPQNNRKKNDEKDSAIQNKERELAKLFAEIAPIKRVAHLTADELAAIAMVINNLIYYIKKDLCDHEALMVPLNSKLSELRALRKEIKICMQKHLAIFYLNRPESKTDERFILPPNDILFPFKLRLNTIFDGREEFIPINKEVIDIDSSLLSPCPTTPFNDGKQETVISYFKKYTRAIHAANNCTPEQLTTLSFSIPKDNLVVSNFLKSAVFIPSEKEEGETPPISEKSFLEQPASPLKTPIDQATLETKNQLLHLLISERKRLDDSKNARFALFFNPHITDAKINALNNTIDHITQNIFSSDDLNDVITSLLQDKDIQQSRNRFALFKCKTTIELHLNDFRKKYLQEQNTEEKTKKSKHKRCCC